MSLEHHPERGNTGSNVRPYARRIADLVAEGPLGKTTIYAAIREGALKARKFGDATVILDRDWQDFLENLPLAGERAA
ncbi:MAG TPA: DNA-binding protein [Rhodomicrobium sp.]|nr:DNA-binding protein [Rhodomicrobium sp.]